MNEETRPFRIHSSMAVHADAIAKDLFELTPDRAHFYALDRLHESNDAINQAFWRNILRILDELTREGEK